MRDDRNRWPAARGSDRPDLVGQGVSAKLITLPRQTVLSGPYPGCMALAGLSGEAVGGDSKASGDVYAIRQRRDRILAVGGSMLDEGWHPEAGVAVADMSAAYAVIELSGLRSAMVIASGTEFSPTAGGRSAARLWHGLSCLLYAYAAEGTYRLHIRSAHLAAAWHMLDRQFGLLARLGDPYETVVARGLGADDSGAAAIQS